MAGGMRAVHDLDAWLAPFLDVLGRKTRRTWAPLYLRGLLGPGERTTIFRDSHGRTAGKAERR